MLDLSRLVISLYLGNALSPSVPPTKPSQYQLPLSSLIYRGGQQTAQKATKKKGQNIECTLSMGYHCYMLVVVPDVC